LPVKKEEIKKEPIKRKRKQPPVAVKVEDDIDLAVPSDPEATDDDIEQFVADPAEPIPEEPWSEPEQVPAVVAKKKKTKTKKRKTAEADPPMSASLAPPIIHPT
jgi:hypothetical protein